MKGCQEQRTRDNHEHHTREKDSRKFWHRYANAWSISKIVGVSKEIINSKDYNKHYNHLKMNHEKLNIMFTELRKNGINIDFETFLYVDRPICVWI